MDLWAAAVPGARVSRRLARARVAARRHEREAQDRAALRRALSSQASQRPMAGRLAAGSGPIFGLGLVRAAERPAHVATTAHVPAAYPFTHQANVGPGPLIGWDVHGGPFAPDPWGMYVRGELHDANMMVLGLKDFGKSSLLKTWGSRHRVVGRRFEVIERKGEYRRLIEAMGGVPLRLEPGVAINPLERVGTPGMRVSLLRGVVRASLARDLTVFERVGLRAALEACDARPADGEVTLPHVIAELRDPSAELAAELNTTQDRALEELREAMLALYDLCTGPLHGMFDQPTSIGSEAWESPAISIDISAVSEHTHGADENIALAIALSCATAFLDAKRNERDRRARAREFEPAKTIRANDEAWRAFSVAGSAEYYSAALKLGRATGVQYISALHRLSDLSATGNAGSRAQQLAEGLASECAIRVLFRHDEHQAPLTAKWLGLSSTEEQLIQTLGQGEALWRIGPRAHHVRHLVAPCEWDLVQTDEAMGTRDPLVAVAT